MNKYFVVKNSIKHGPLTIDQLKEHNLKKKDLVWKEGTDDWIKAEALPELSEFIQPEVPKTPFEKKAIETKSSLKANFLIPILVGLLLGFLAIASWNSVKSKAYGNKTNSDMSYYSGGEISTPYEKFMDKYLAGDYGFSALRDNEDFYYSNTEQGIFRPLKAVLAMFSSKTQFYVGKDESAPFVSFILLWIIYATVAYLTVFGIQMALHRANT